MKIRESNISLIVVRIIYSNVNSVSELITSKTCNIIIMLIEVKGPVLAKATIKRRQLIDDWP